MGVLLFAKNESQITMNMFKAMVGMQFECSIKIVQSNGQNELHFLSSSWKKLDMEYQFTYPRTFEQNGLIEERVRRLIEGGLTLLLKGGVPVKYCSIHFT